MSDRQRSLQPRPGYVMVSDWPRPLREVPRNEPTLTCFCGASLKVKEDDRCTFAPCVRCNATFYVITHEGPFMGADDA